MTQDRIELESAIKRRLKANPADSRALCAQISFEEELAAGVRESLAARKWIAKLTC